MEIIEYKDEFSSDIKQLFRELQEYIVKLDPYNFNVLSDGYEEKAFEIDMKKINDFKGQVYLAMMDNKVVGFIMGIIHEPAVEFDYIRSWKTGEVIELVVTKNIRHQNIGASLLMKMEEYFKNSGCKTIDIDVFGYNDIAINFYHKNNYHNRMITVSKKINGEDYD